MQQFDVATLDGECHAQSRATCRYHKAVDAVKNAPDFMGYVRALEKVHSIQASKDFDARLKEFIEPTVSTAKANTKNPDIYEVARQELIRKNAIEAVRPDNVADIKPWQMLKISNMAERKGVPFEEFLAGVMVSDAAWAAVVVKETSRQSYWEKTLVNHLNKHKDLAGTKTSQLPNHGKNAQTLWNGKIVKGIHDDVKTLDLKVSDADGNLLGYVMHKYTDGGGGGQDNQHQDIRNSLQQVRDNQGFFVAAILDGKYHQEGRRSINALRTKYATHPDVFIGTYTEYVPWLKARLAAS